MMRVEFIGGKRPMCDACNAPNSDIVIVNDNRTIKLYLHTGCLKDLMDTIHGFLSIGRSTSAG